MLLLETEVPNEKAAAPEDWSMDEEPAVGYRNPRKKRTKDFVVRGAPKARTFEKRQRTQLKFNNGIKNRSLKLQLHLWSERAFNKTVRQNIGLEVAKQVVGSSAGLREVSDWTLWRGRYPSKRYKRCPKHRPRKRTKIMVVHLDRLAPYQGTTQDELA
jgi:hypothetical protein